MNDRLQKGGETKCRIAAGSSFLPSVSPFGACVSNLLDVGGRGGEVSSQHVFVVG